MPEEKGASGREKAGILLEQGLFSLNTNRSLGACQENLREGIN